MSTDFKNNRKSLRLQGYDYSLPGCYYITICTKDREYLFGEIVGVENFQPERIMKLSEGGKELDRCINSIPSHFPNATIDCYCIMPDHVHLIIILEDNEIDNRVENFQPLQNTYQKIISISIGSIVKGLKIGVTKWYKQNTNISSIWQRNYFEHIIRNDTELQKIRLYIQNNPLNWQNDGNRNI